MYVYKWIQNTYLFFLASFASTLSTATEKVTLISQTDSQSTLNRWIEKEFEVHYHFLWLHLSQPYFQLVCQWQCHYLQQYLLGEHWKQHFSRLVSYLIKLSRESPKLVAFIVTLFLPFWIVIGLLPLMYELCRAWVSVGSCSIWRPKYVNTALSSWQILNFLWNIEITCFLNLVCKRLQKNSSLWLHTICSSLLL